MNILEYIDSLIDAGYSEEDAGMMADCLYCDSYMYEDHFEE